MLWWILAIFVTILILAAIGLLLVLYAFGRVQEATEEQCNENEDSVKGKPENKS